MTIKECPFCGDHEVSPHGRANAHWIVCQGCKAEGPIADDKNEAIELWNDREPESQDPRDMGWVGQDGLP